MVKRRLMDLTPDEEGIWVPDVRAIILFHALIPRRPTKHDRDERGVQGRTGRGKIEAAIARCSNPTPAPETLDYRAAFLLRGICQDHPFINANKRTAYVTAISFLRINGVHVHATRQEVIDLMLDVAQDRIDVDEMAAWIHLHAYYPEDIGWRLLWRRLKDGVRAADCWRGRRTYRAGEQLMQQEGFSLFSPTDADTSTGGPVPPGSAPQA